VEHDAVARAAFPRDRDEVASAGMLHDLTLSSNAGAPRRRHCDGPQASTIPPAHATRPRHNSTTLAA
jgi:hypothetical protein